MDEVVGYVERLSGDIVEGWALCRSGRLPRLALAFGDRRVDLGIPTLERGDVAALHGDAGARAGFLFHLDVATVAAAVAAVASGQPVQVLAEETALPLSVDAGTLALPADTPASGPEAATAPASAVIGLAESCTQFAVAGWAIDGSRAAPVRLLANGRPVDATVVRASRPDITDRTGRRIADAAFSIDIPGTVWLDTPPGAACILQVACGDTVLRPGTLAVDRPTAARWIRAAVQMPEGPDKQYQQMLALEHLHHGGMLELVDDATRAGLLAFARWLKLDEQVFRREDDVSAEVAASESLDTLLLWDAMRVLNAKLVSRPASAVAAVVETLQSCALTDTARQWLVNLAVQVTCDSGELEQLREVADFATLHALADGEEASAVSIAIPVLVADRRIDWATTSMKRLAGGLPGWLQTGCLRHAMRSVLDGERRGTVPPEHAEAFRAAFFELLDSLDGDWFSRLHDKALVETMAGIVLAGSRFADDHRRWSEYAAIRHYGLNPAFWSILEAGNGIPVDGLIAKAHGHWLACRRAVMSGDLDPESLAASIDWFLHRRNVDAPAWLREIVANRAHTLADRASAGPLTALLLRSAGTERMRLAAMPDAPDNPQMYAGDDDTDLSEHVRTLGGRPVSSRHRLQREAVAALRSLRDTLQAGSSPDAGLLARIDEIAALLGEARTQHLGIDVLASTLAMQHAHGRPVQALLTRIREHLQRAIRQTARDGILAAPVQTALARLATLREDRFARAVIDEARRLLDADFPGALPSESDIFPDAPPGESPVLLPAGWLTDTRVLVPLDEDEADTRTRIRDSWARTFAADGIRTQFVRFSDSNSADDSDDTVHLACPPGASRAQRLLLMLRWAWHHAPAAFVMVMPANAYVAVPRLLEAAEYRKHHYYGSVIRRTDIDLARSGSGDDDFRLEKSPEESLFVDDGTGMVLSRHALAQLFIAARSPRGQRLLSDARHAGKLVGDLLAIAGVAPSDEDFHCHRRIGLDGGVPVAQRDNTFLPGSDTPTVLVTCGDDDDFARIAAGAGSPGLSPRKLWPSFASPALGHNTNQLELLSAPEALDRLRSAAVTVVAVIRNEMLVLPRFLEHYRRLGAGAFIVVDNCSDDGTREYLLTQPDVVAYSADTEYRLSHYGVTWQHTVLANHCLGKWVVLADADEFLVYEDCEKIGLPQFTRALDAEGADAALVRMIDMYPFGDLADADFTREEPFTAAPWFDREPLVELMFGGGQFSNSRNFVNGLRHRIAPSRINAYVSQKYALFRYRPWMRISEGVHYTANMQVSAKPAFFAHFKYHAGFKEKVMTEVRRKQHYNGAEEYRRYAAMLTEGSGAFGSEALSMRYEGSASFVAVARRDDGNPRPA